MPPVSYLETGIIYRDDNLERLAQFPAECIDLIYLDPPFFSNRHYEVIWGDEAEIRSFEDRWEGGIYVYIDWMRERVMEMHRVLKRTGSLYLHCDWHASHYLKVMMDDIFGDNRFRNEIVWHYGSGGRSTNFYPRKHDTIFWYSKGPNWTFNAEAVSVPRNQCQECGQELAKWNNLKKEVDKDGRVFRSITSGGKVYKYYDDDPALPADVWLGISHLHQKDPERRGYPTQKPERLLERIIAAGSRSGEIVLDPFCGCGTTLVAAQRLGRQWVGIDISPTAVELMKRRLQKAGVLSKDIKLVGMPVTEEQLRSLKPFEFQNWVVQRFNGTHSSRKSGDMGIDGYSFMLHEPIQVKQSERVGRNIVDNFETAIKREKRTKGYIVAFSFTKGAYEEAARVKSAENLEIELVEVADLLKDTSDLVTPAASGQLVADVPLPKARPSDARPSVEQLVESDRDGG
ncbi:MAG: DNA methyltransferase [Actinomycetota bacterium]